MADLTKLKAQDRQILLVVGPSSVVWRLDDLSTELVKNGIKSLTDPVDLIDYFEKRPALFTVVNNHVWSKIAPRKMPSAPKNHLQNHNSVPAVHTEKSPEPVVKESSEENMTPYNSMTNHIKTDDIDSNPQNDVKYAHKNAWTGFRNSPNFQSRTAPGSKTFVPPPRFLAEKKKEYERFSTEKRNGYEKYSTERRETTERFYTEKKQNNGYEKQYPAEKFERFPTEKSLTFSEALIAGVQIPPSEGFTPRFNSILMPSNAVFNPVANLIHNCPHSMENSVRICIESRRYIMYKVDWVFSKLPSHIKKNWKSAKELIDDLYYEQDFFVGPHCCHMRAALQRSPHPDKIAKIIVDKLLEHQGSMPSKDLYDDLPQKIKLYLKTSKGLKGFVGFYPALFDEKNELNSSSDDQIIELMTVPIFKTEKDLKLPHGSDPKKADGDQHQMVINCVLNLMKMSHMDSQNSTVFIFANIDKPYYKMEWVYEKLPKNVKSRFDNYKSLKIYLFRSSRTFLIIGNFIQLRTKLVDLPCDKSISLEILRLQQRLSSPSVQDVLQKLPSYCNGRIRSVAELQKFFGLYPEFHGKNELPYSPHQSHGATSKTNSPADFRQNSDQPPNLQESLQQMSQQIQDLQQKNQPIPEGLRKNIDTLADQFRQISMGSSHSNSSNSLQDPAVISYTKKTKNSKEEFMDTEGPIETLDKNDSIIEIWGSSINDVTSSPDILNPYLPEVNSFPDLFNPSLTHDTETWFRSQTSLAPTKNLQFHP